MLDLRLCVLAAGLALLGSACWSPEQKKASPPPSSSSMTSVPSPERIQVSEEATKKGSESRVERANRLMSEARSLAHDGKLTEAVAVYEQLTREFTDLIDDSNEIMSESFASEARDELRPLRCRMRRPKDRTFSTPEEVVTAIKAAFVSNDPTPVAELAACHFLIGPPDSDSGTTADPYILAPNLLKWLQGAEWTSFKYQKDITGATLPTRKGAIGFGIQVLEEREGKFYWGWVNSTSTNRDTLKELVQGMF